MSQPEEKITHPKRLGPDAMGMGILAAVLVFFYWGFLTGRFFIWDDTLMEFYPGVNYFAKSILAGRFPLWFPGVHDGSPFYTDLQVGVFYLPQWLLIPFAGNGRLPFLVYQQYIVLHYLLGGLFMYAFLKEIKCNAMAALAGALVFCLSGFASLRIMGFVIIQVYTWLPLQLFFVYRLASRKSRWAWPGLLASMILSLTAGFPQVTLYCWYLVIAYWLYCGYCLRRQNAPDWKTTARQVAVGELPKMVGTFLLVFGLSACLVIPAAQNWWHTARPRQSFDVRADSSVPYPQLVMLLAPNFFGKSQATEPPVPFWGYDPHTVTVSINHAVNARPGYWEYWEFNAYAGQIFWLALLLILGNWRSLENKSVASFFMAAWALGIWFMMGRYGGLFQVLDKILPGVSLFRIPSRMSCVATFGAAVLIACSVDLVMKRGRILRWWPVFIPAAICGLLALGVFFGGDHLSAALRRPARLSWSQNEILFSLAVGIICACALILAVRVQRRGVQQLCLGCLLLVTVADFHHAFAGFQRGNVSPAEYFPETTQLLPLLKDYREHRGPFRFGQTNRGRLSEEIATVRNLPYFHDFLEVPEGYTSFFLNNVIAFQAISNEEAKIAIQNIVVSMDRDAAGKDWLGTRTNSFPRAKFFPRVRHFESRTALLTALDNNQIDWRQEAAVTDSDVPEFKGHESSGDEVQFESISPESYSVKYHVTQPGIIFVSQAFYPGWRANDDRTKLVETFGAFQGIVIPEAGEGQVIVQFSPTPLKVGIAISLVSLLVMILLIRRQSVSPLLPQSGESPPSTDRTVSV